MADILAGEIPRFISRSLDLFPSLSLFSSLALAKVKCYLNFLKLARQRAHKARLARRDSPLLYLTTQRNASSRQSQGAKVAKGESEKKNIAIEEDREKERERKRGGGKAYD